MEQSGFRVGHSQAEQGKPLATDNYSVSVTRDFTEP